MVARSLALFLAFGCVVACSKSEEKPTHVFDLGVKPAPQPVAAQSGAPIDAGAILYRDIARLEGTEGTGDSFGQAAAPVAPAATTKPAPAVAASGAAAVAAAKSKADETALAQARVACGQCFASLPARAGDPDRSAHVSFTVVPTGTVSRADVSSDDTSEASVLECLQQTAQAVLFSDNGDGPLRTYAIDVKVHAGNPNGGR